MSDEPLEEACDHVLVIGAANHDIKGQPEGELAPGSSVPGRIRTGLGGVARNVAENLARLEVETVLLTAIGDDETGHHMLSAAAGIGINVHEALVVNGYRTGAYMALLNQQGGVSSALEDLSVLNALTPEYFEARRALFEAACMVVIDANLSPEAIQKVVGLCEEYDVAICADPTSTSLASRLCEHLPHLYMASPNVPEAGVLCGEPLAGNDRDAALAAAARLVSMGVEVAIITLGENGAVYASEDTRGHIPAVTGQIVDLTGAGDAMTAAIIFGLLEDIPLDECVRLGVTAATLTLRTRETVRPDLSVDLLYDELNI